jgi:hypothetical protein
MYILYTTLRGGRRKEENNKITRHHPQIRDKSEF